MLRLTFAICMLCVSLTSVAHAQAPSDVPPSDPARAWPSAGLAPAPSVTVPPDYELWQVEQQLARLRAARPRVFWPFVLTITGAGTAIFGTLGVAALGSTMRETRYRWDAQGDRHAYTYVDPEDRNDLRLFSVIMAVGLGVTAGGLALLVPRLRARHRLALEAAPLKRKRLELLRSTRPSFGFDAHGAGAAARFVF